MWKIGNGLYDLTMFRQQHPGGEEYISQSKDTDCTLMFYTHHSSETLKRFESQGSSHRFWSRACETTSEFLQIIQNDKLYMSMKDEVQKVLKANGGPGPKSYMFYCLYGFYAAYALTITLCGITFSNGSYLLTILLIVISGACGTTIAGFGHNFVHQKVRTYNWFVLDSVGFPSRSWRRDHCLNHHMYTNNPDLDPDILDWAKVGIYFDNSRITSEWLTLLHPLLMACGYWLYSHYSALVKWKNTNATLWLSFVFPLLLLFSYTNSILWSFVLFEAIKFITVAWFINIAGLPHVHNSDHPNNGWDGELPWSSIQLGSTESYLPEASLFTAFLFGGLNEHLVHHLFPYVDMSKYHLVKEVIERHCKPRQGNMKDMLAQRFDLLQTGTQQESE